MSLVVGLTGGIGSGKTTIASVFSELGVPVYNADIEAKMIMVSPRVKHRIINVLGEKSYDDNGLNRDHLRAAIFENDQIRLKINSIVHPEVAIHFEKWLSKQNAPFVIKESALIFEIGIQDQFDLIILVVADKNERIKRLLKRQGMTKSAILSIMDKQWCDTDKMERSDFVVFNNHREEVHQQIQRIQSEILKRTETS